MTKADNYRIETERQIARALISNALDKGYTLKIDNGGDQVIKTKSQTYAMRQIMASQWDRIYLFNAKDECVAWLFLVYGNDGYDVLSDYTVNCEELGLLDEAEKISEEREAAARKMGYL